MSDSVNIETLLRSLDDGPQWPCKQAAFTLRGCLDDAELGYACRELGIETVEQLKTRLAPDPRVAVLEVEIDRLVEVNRRLVNERAVLLDVKTTDGLTASEWVMRTAIAESKLKRIAAQRGEGQGMTNYREKSIAFIVDNIDGPMLVCENGSLHWLTWVERFLLALGLITADKLNAKHERGEVEG